MALQRKISVPKPIRLVDPISGASSSGPEGTLTFRGFLDRAFQNPLWNESMKNGLAQLAIARAAQEAEEQGNDSFVLSEEDWQLLEQAVQHPKTALGTGQVIFGFGYLPTMARQLIPMQDAVVRAERLPAS
jgi:hypothetical protein